MQDRNDRHRRTIALAQRLLAGAALLMLAGCLSTAKEDVLLGDAALLDPNLEATTNGTATQADPAGYVDPMVASAADRAPTGSPGDPLLTADSSRPADLGELMMQSTGVNAGRSSIFSAYQPTEEDAAPLAPETTASLVPAGLPQHPVNAATASLFSTPKPSQVPLYPLPEDAAVE